MAESVINAINIKQVHLQLHFIPTRPWANSHIDYDRPINSQMILVIVGAHSKWIKAIPTNGSTSQVVIEELRFLVSQFGLPERIVSDNNTCFTSHEFKEFLKRHGIDHIVSAPYHPASNGLAERAVQAVTKDQCETGLLPFCLIIG